MSDYKHTSALCGVKWAPLWGAGFGLLLALLFLPVGLGYYERYGTMLPMGLMLGIACIVAVMAAALTALTVELDGRNLKWFFRGGFMRRSVPLTSIERFETCGPHGWRLGLRYCPSRSGWFEPCYAVGARNGIRVILRTGKQFCIETDEPKTLEFELREALKALNRTNCGRPDV